MLRPHLRIDRFAAEAPYQRPRSGGSARNTYGRAFGQHAEDLKRDLATAWADADGLLFQREGPVGDAGAYVAFQTAVGARLPELEWKREGLRLAAASRDDEGRAVGTVFVPDTARGFLDEKLTGYGAVAAGRRQQNEHRFVAIDQFSAARLADLWVDGRDMPQGEASQWWECWCWPDRIHNLEAKAAHIGLPVSADRLSFPERIVAFVFANAAQMARLVSGTDSVAELRLGRDTAAFFRGESPGRPGWVDRRLSGPHPGRPLGKRASGLSLGHGCEPRTPPPVDDAGRRRPTCGPRGLGRR